MWKFAAGHRIDAALFDITTRDEIVTDTNSGGRTTFKNARRTSRRGAEFMYTGQLAESLRATAEPELAARALRRGLRQRQRRPPSTSRLATACPGTPERSASPSWPGRPRRPGAASMRASSPCTPASST